MAVCVSKGERTNVYRASVEVTFAFCLLPLALFQVLIFKFQFLISRSGDGKVSQSKKGFWGTGNCA